ncbi:MAG: hypothetical protein AAF251_06220 [Pseudomonadota bacterium]
MHKDQRDLIIQLCTQAGMEMEDAVTSALTMGSLDAEDFVQGINRLEGRAATVAALISAAKALATPRN